MRKKWEYSQTNVKLLFEKLGHLIPAIRLHGGETTCLDMDKLRTTIDLCEEFSIPISILTNGYDILGVGEEHLEKFQYIVLNGHGANEEWLDYVQKTLKRSVGTKVYRLKRYDYWDMDWVADNSPKTGRVCDSPIGDFGWEYGKIGAFYHDCLYPCCGLFYTNPDIGDAMRGAGWHVRNPNVEEDTRDLDDLPPEFFDACFNHCAFNALERPTIDIRRGVTGIPGRVR